MLHHSEDAIRVGSVTARPGERATGHWHVADMQDGTPVRLPIVLLRGRRPGPVLYIQAASDGDELNGIAALHRFLDDVPTNDLRGAVIAIPVANFHAFHARSAHSPVDGKKMNRCFPGDARGSSTERIAHALFYGAVLQADLCIDLHQGGVRPMIDEVRVRVGRGHPRHADCMRLARTFGIGYILDEEGPRGQLARAAPDEGIPTIDPELGGSRGWDATSIRKGRRGLMNVARAYGLLPGDPRAPERQIVVDAFAPVRPNRGGFIRHAVALYDFVAAGQTLATVHTVFGEPLETIAAPLDGIVWSMSVDPMASTGEIILTLGINPRMTEDD
jgi:uncharacterized protein